jgi:hypothetical protein
MSLSAVVHRVNIVQGLLLVYHRMYRTMNIVSFVSREHQTGRRRRSYEDNPFGKYCLWIPCFVESRLSTLATRSCVLTDLLRDFSVMNKTVALAKSNNVLAGAHPSLPDLQGFGRREMAIEPVSRDVISQCKCIKNIHNFAGRARVLLHLPSRCIGRVFETLWPSDESRTIFRIDFQSLVAEIATDKTPRLCLWSDSTLYRPCTGSCRCHEDIQI